MITFGTALSLWLWFQDSHLAWWMPLLIAAIALMSRSYLSLGLSATCILLFMLRFAVGQPWVRYVSQSQATLIALAALALLARFIYESAVEAALTYCERLQTVFDLHRRKVLEGLHLAVPANLDDERQLWSHVSQHLYRGWTPPSGGVFRYVKDEKAREPLPSPSLELLVPARLVPAGTILKEDDLTQRAFVPEEVPLNVAGNQEALVGKSAIADLPALQPVPVRILRRPEHVQPSLRLGLAVSPEEVLGGRLRPGERVDVIFQLPGEQKTQEGPKEPQELPLVIFPGLLLADLIAQSAQSYIAVIEVPAETALEFFRVRSGATIHLAQPTLPNSTLARE